MSCAPAKPILALTIGLAGKRTITCDSDPHREPRLWAELAFVFETIAARLDALHAAPTDSPSLIEVRFDTQKSSRLTLVTGLSDGADQVASQVFLSDAVGRRSVDRALGAILPCAKQAYIDNSPVSDTAWYRELELKCDFIIELDGEMPAKPDKPPTDPKGKISDDDAEIELKRGRAFSAQSELLLRNCDILVVVDDPTDAGKIGGTRQTLRTAVELGIPVIEIRLGEAGIRILRGRRDLDPPGPKVSTDPGDDLRRLVDRRLGLVGDRRDATYVKSLLKEYYAEDLPKDRFGWLGSLWDGFQKRFEKPGKNPPSGTAAAPFADYRKRASDLGAYYAGRYRGAFLTGYVLAVGAVSLAVTSLLILIFHKESAGHVGSPWWSTLVALGMLKLAAVAAIFMLASDANKRRLAQKAADYRYLAERLRAMIFLPAAGSMRAPNAWSQPYTTRVSAQGVIDQLFFAIERQARPVEAVEGARVCVTIQIDAKAAHAKMRRSWIHSQSVYHERAAHTQENLASTLEGLSRALNSLVILIVVIDLGLTFWDAFNPFPCELHELFHDGVAPFMIAAAAILPAAVASLNGVRFQSECSRLADRSRHLAQQFAHLERRADRRDVDDLRIIDALRLGEDMARLQNDEVAEWSAIYGKDFVEM